MKEKTLQKEADQSTPPKEPPRQIEGKPANQCSKGSGKGKEGKHEKKSQQCIPLLLPVGRAL